MKAKDFDSDYLTEFTMYEEIEGSIRRYPRTDQLQVLLWDLNQKFKLMLPRKIADVDVRADDFMKIQRKVAVDLFCHLVNASRSDGLHLFGLLDRDRVAHVSVVQQITEHTPFGPQHSFKFYAGEEFFTDIFLSGRKVAFSEHALERFGTRTPGVIGDT
jgi:hypothetical protein